MQQSTVASGMMIGTRNSPHAETVSELLCRMQSWTDDPTDRLLILGGFNISARDDHETLIRRLAESPSEWGSVWAFGPKSRRFAQLAEQSGVSVQSTVLRYTLRDVITRHWESRGRPVAAVSSLRGSNVAWAVDDSLGTQHSLTATGVAQRKWRVGTLRSEYDLISGFGAVAATGAGNNASVVLPNTVCGMGLIAVGPDAFACTETRTLMLPAPVRSIGTGAFRMCTALTTVVLPETLDFIGTRAFQGSSALTTVRIPDSVRTVETRAFADCSELREVILPNGQVSIAKDAFVGCHPELRFVVGKGSAAAEWAGEKAVAVESSPVHAVYPRDTRRFVKNGIEYRVLPGGMLEASRTSSNVFGSIALPSEIEGYPLKGIGHGFVGIDSKIDKLSLPESVTWIAPSAFSPESSLRRVRTPVGVQSVGQDFDSDLLSRRKFRTIRDLDSVKLSLRMICRLLDLAVPQAFVHLADEPFATLSSSMLTSGERGLHFAKARGLTPKTVNKLQDRGVCAFVSDGPIRAASGAPVPYIHHPDPKGAYEDVCEWLAGLYDATTIAVTGSIGKTSTKEMLQRVCSTSRSTLYSAKNQNGVGQVGRHIQKLTDKTEVFIQETGAGRPKLVERSARLLKADAFVITNIGLNHIGNYGGSQDRLLADKLSHDEHMPDHGIAFVNFDDPKLREVSLKHRIVSYGVDSRDTDYWAENITEANGEVRFTIVEASNGTRTDALVRSWGRHNVSNAVASYAVGRWLKIPPYKIVKGIASYKGEGLRQNLTEVNGRRILVDCYNSSEVAIGTTADALESLNVESHGRRIYVLGDIDDKLGNITEEVHRRVGKDLADRTGIDKFYLFGKHAAWIAEELQSQGRDIVATVDRDELHAALREDLTGDDVVAFKGGQQMALSITIDRLFGTSFILSDGDVLEKRGIDVNDGNVKYRIIDEFGAELRKVRPDSGLTELIVAPSQNGEPVYMIGRAACAGTELQRAVIPSPVRTLAPAAFYQVSSLKQITLPPTLVTIGSSAFNGCSSLSEVIVPEGVTTIGSRAFYRCTGLRRVVLPGSIRTIEPEVFTHCESVTVECPAASFAESFIRSEYPQIDVVSI